MHLGLVPCRHARGGEAVTFAGVKGQERSRVREGGREGGSLGSRYTELAAPLRWGSLPTAGGDHRVQTLHHLKDRPTYVTAALRG